MCRRCNDKASTWQECERASPPQLVNTLVCLRSFLRISINFLRAISRRAASAGCCGCHAVGVIVRNEIIEMFPSSSSPINIFPDFFFFAATARALFWLRLCVSKWARHMLECAYANEFVYQSDSRWARATQRVVSPLLTFPRSKKNVLCIFFPVLFSFILFLFIYFHAVLFSPPSSSPPRPSSCTTSPQFINNVFIYHENLFWN